MKEEESEAKEVETPVNEARKAGPLREGVDYYMEGPYMVFTAEFLRRRGYCCESGCRHCPYKSVSDDTSEEKRKP